MKLVALTPLLVLGQRVEVGSTFEADDENAGVLQDQGQAATPAEAKKLLASADEAASD